MKIKNIYLYLFIGFMVFVFIGCGSNILTQKSNSSIGDSFNNNSSTSPSTVVPSPEILSTTITSTDSDSDLWYEDADIVSIVIEFSEAVDVDTTLGVPEIQVDLSSGSKNAVYVSGSGTVSLTFNLTIASGDEQCDGNLALNSLNLNGGTIESVATGESSNNSGLQSSVSGVKIDTTDPVLSSIDVTANDGSSSAEKSVTTTWTATDNCEVASREFALGTYIAGSCTQENIAAFGSIGSVSSYQAISGTAPFDATNTFDLLYDTQYCSSLLIEDGAGHAVDDDSSSWNMVYTLPSPAMWFDSGDATSLFSDSGCTTQASSGSEIACWADKSANENDITHNGTSTKPFFGGTEKINGRDVIKFDGSDALFGSDVFGGTQGELDIYILLTYDANSNNFLMNFNGTTTAGNGRYSMHYYWSGTATSYWDVGSASGTRRVSGGYGVTRANPNVINYRNSILNTNQSGWANGVQKFGDTSGHSATTTGGFALGSVGAPYNGRIAEVIIYNSYLSTADRQVVEGHLACKWGTESLLPVGHPYKNCP